MKPSEIKELVKQMVMNQTDQALVTDTLDKIVQAYENTYTVSESMKEEKSKIEEQVKSLQEVNMRFFTQLQSQELPKEEVKEEPKEIKLEEIFKF